MRVSSHVNTHTHTRTVKDSAHTHTHPEGLRRSGWSAYDVHLGHVIGVSAQPMDEQDAAAVNDTPPWHQPPLLVHLEGGVRDLEAHRLVPRTVVEVHCGQSTHSRRVKHTRGPQGALSSPSPVWELTLRSTGRGRSKD